MAVWIFIASECVEIAIFGFGLHSSKNDYCGGGSDKQIQFFIFIKNGSKIFHDELLIKIELQVLGMKLIPKKMTVNGDPWMYG